MAFGCRPPCSLAVLTAIMAVEYGLDTRRALEMYPHPTASSRGLNHPVAKVVHYGTPVFRFVFPRQNVEGFMSNPVPLTALKGPYAGGRAGRTHPAELTRTHSKIFTTEDTENNLMFSLCPPCSPW
jgi:hypothetical protein